MSGTYRKPDPFQKLDAPMSKAEAPLPAPLPAPAPKIDTSAPEFKAAVQSAVDALLPALLEKFAAVKGAPAEGEDKGMVSALALQLAELTGQGQGRIYVAPEVVARRRQAFEEMKTLLLELRAKRELPIYRLVNKVVLNLGPTIGDTLIDPLFRDANKVVQPVEINWAGVPNLGMAPVNEPAKRVHALFTEWSGGMGEAPAHDELLAVTSEGAVVRGTAARSILNNDKPRAGRTEDWGGDGEFIEAHEPAATIRNASQAAVRKVQVLGTLTRPVEVV